MKRSAHESGEELWKRYSESLEGIDPELISEHLLELAILQINGNDAVSAARALTFFHGKRQKPTDQEDEQVGQLPPLPPSPPQQQRQCVEVKDEPLPEEERCLQAALWRLNADDFTKDAAWDVRSQLTRALSVDPQFVPALLLLRNLHLAVPSILQPSDPPPAELVQRLDTAPEEQKERARELCKRLLDHGEQSVMGSRFFLAGLVKQRLDRKPEEAVHFFRRAALEKGNFLAHYSLATCLLSGEGVTKSVADALGMFNAIATVAKEHPTRTPHAAALCNLGVLFQRGEGTPKNFREAARFYRMAADEGNATAQLNLGLCFKNGKGVQADPVEAARLFRRAATQGVADAQFNLGLCLEQGLGVARDRGEAAKWFKMAADQGNAAAREALAPSKEKK